MKRGVGLWLSGLLAAGVAVLPSAASAEWQPVETVRTYAISGRTGPELYQSIGERGPKIGGGRVIAQTTFKLTWTRKYEPQGDACVLVSAVPKLIITYTVPKPSQSLPSTVGRNWQTFISGVEAHERVHGRSVKDMVRKIEAATVGLTMPGDPDCRKIRTELVNRLGPISQAQRRQGQDFDRVEMSTGGNVQQLILALVNGG